MVDVQQRHAARLATAPRLVGRRVEGADALAAVGKTCQRVDGRFLTGLLGALGQVGIGPNELDRLFPASAARCCRASASARLMAAVTLAVDAWQVSASLNAASLVSTARPQAARAASGCPASAARRPTAIQCAAVFDSAKACSWWCPASRAMVATRGWQSMDASPWPRSFRTLPRMFRHCKARSEITCRLHHAPGVFQAEHGFVVVADEPGRSRDIHLYPGHQGRVAAGLGLSGASPASEAAHAWSPRPWASQSATVRTRASNAWPLVPMKVSKACHAAGLAGCREAGHGRSNCTGPSPGERCGCMRGLKPSIALPTAVAVSLVRPPGAGQGTGWGRRDAN